MSDKLPGIPTTLTSSTIATTTVDADKICTELFSLGSSVVKAITDNPRERDAEKIPSSLALGSAVDDMNRLVDKLQTLVERYKFTPVISEPIINSFFGDGSGWLYNGFYFDRGTAIYINKTNTVSNRQATLRIPSSSFAIKGQYFIEVNINTLTSGNISIIDFENNELKNIQLPGKYTFQVTVTNTQMYTLEFVVNQLNVNEIVVIDSIYVYHVKDSIEKYFAYQAEIFNVGDSGVASVLWVEKRLGETSAVLRTYVDNKTSDLNNRLLTHITDNNDPHKVTCEQIKAATVDHTHDLNDLGAAADNHTHTPESIGAATEDHTHTLSSLDAAPLLHTHTLSSLGAAADDHTHMLNTLGGYDAVGEHLNSFANPHLVTKKQVGLGNVDNFGTATPTDISNGTAEKFIDATGLKIFLDETFDADPSLRNVQLIPNKVYETNFSLKENEYISFSLKNKSQYRIIIAAGRSLGFGNLKINIASMSASVNYYNNYAMGRTVNGDNNIGWWTNNGTDGFYVLPDGVGNNMGTGEVTLDTTSFTMRGNFETQIGSIVAGGSGIPTAITNNTYPVWFSGLLRETSSITTDTVPLFLSHAGRNTDTVSGKIIVVELTSELIAGKNVVVDLTPLGATTDFRGSLDTIPRGWKLENGDWLNKDNFADLFKHVVDSKLILSEAEYNAQVASTGKCDFFSHGTGANINDFRIPLMPESLYKDGTIPLIKVALIGVEEDVYILNPLSPEELFNLEAVLT